MALLQKLVKTLPEEGRKCRKFSYLPLLLNPLNRLILIGINSSIISDHYEKAFGFKFDGMMNIFAITLAPLSQSSYAWYLLPQSRNNRMD